jgi:CubicO group peptidase (beta-lactamase class C family)
MIDLRFQHLGELITELMEKHQVPGAAVGILQDGVIQSAGFGITNIEHPQDVTVDTLFQVGSISKTVTATMIMMLVEAGKVDLDATFRSYIPDFKVKDEDAAANATIRHLLTHTSGWAGDVFRDTGQGDDAAARYMALMADVDQIAPIGRIWAYNNANFYLLGHLIETLTGETFQLAVQKMVFDPLGMHHTYLEPADVMTQRFAVGHLVEGGEVKVGRPWAMPRAVYPVGGIITCIADLLAYAEFHFGDGTTAAGKRLLTAESMALMQQSYFEISGDHHTIGLSWHVFESDGIRFIYHGGGTKGQVSRLFLSPAEKFAFAIFTNGDKGGHITEDTTRWVLKEYFGIEVADPEPVEVEEGMLEVYVGRYSRPYADVDIKVENGRLMAQVTYKQGFPNTNSPPAPPPPPATFAVYDTDKVIAIDEYFEHTRGEFFRQGDGAIGWFRLGSRLHHKLPTDVGS